MASFLCLSASPEIQCLVLRHDWIDVVLVACCSWCFCFCYLCYSPTSSDAPGLMMSPEVSGNFPLNPFPTAVWSGDPIDVIESDAIPLSSSVLLSSLMATSNAQNSLH